MAQSNRIEVLVEEFANKLADELINIVGDMVPMLLEKVAEKMSDRLSLLTHPAAEQPFTTPETTAVVNEDAPNKFIPLPEPPRLYALVSPAPPVKKEKVDFDYWDVQIAWAQEDPGFDRLQEVKDGISTVMRRVRSSQPEDYDRLYALIGTINAAFASRSDYNAMQFLGQLHLTCKRMFLALNQKNFDLANSLFQEYRSMGETLAKPKKFFGEAMERVAERVTGTPLPQVRQKFLVDFGEANRKLDELKAMPKIAIHSAYALVRKMASMMATSSPACCARPSNVANFGLFSRSGRSIALQKPGQ